MHFAGINEGCYREVFPRGQWLLLQDKWELGRLRPVMDQVYNESRIRNDFAVEKIIGITQLS